MAATTPVRIPAGTSNSDTSPERAGISICGRCGNTDFLRTPIAVDKPVDEASRQFGSKKIRKRSWSLAPVFKMPGTPQGEEEPVPGDISGFGKPADIRRVSS